MLHKRRLKIISSLVLSLVFLILNVRLSFALECGDSCDDKGGEEKLTCLKEIQSICQAKLNETKAKKQTLESTISYINNKIYLAQNQINQTKAEIALLEEEIVSLGGKIEVLNVSLDKMTETLVKRIASSYKSNTVIQPLYLLLTSNGFSDFFLRYKYLKVTQTHDRKLIFALEEARTDYDNQKQDKEDKQREVEALQKKLVSQQSALKQQQTEKQSLLLLTKNDESRYQKLLAEAIAQKNAFSRFISGQGGASLLSNQTFCDGWGCYYNQRDSQWGNQLIGFSDYSMATDGCLVTSMAMIVSHYGKSLTPSQIAGSPDAFSGNTALMRQGSWTVNGITTTRTPLGSSNDLIDSELESGRPVIVGIIQYGSSSPEHFLVIKAKSDGSYIMNDPYINNGHDVKFTDHYSINSIARVDRVTVQ